jgi:hypothetical protein
MSSTLSRVSGLAYRRLTPSARFRAYTRRSHHHQVVSTGGGNLQCQPRLRLACHILQVRRRHRRRRTVHRGLAPCRPVVRQIQHEFLRIGVEIHRHLGQRTISAHSGTGDEHRLPGVGPRHHKLVEAGLYPCHHRRQDTAHRPQPPVQTQLRHEDRPPGAADVPGGFQRRHHDGQVKGRSTFGQGSWNEVHGDFPPAQRNAGILCCGLDPLGGLLQRSVREPQ